MSDNSWHVAIRVDLSERAKLKGLVSEDDRLIRMLALAFGQRIPRPKVRYSIDREMAYAWARMEYCGFCPKPKSRLARALKLLSFLPTSAKPREPTHLARLLVGLIDRVTLPRPAP